MESEAVYGSPPAELAAGSPGAIQTSPFIPGATAIEALADCAVTRFVIQAPPGTLERSYVLAQGLRALAPGGRLIALAPKTKGGTRLAAELAAFGCDVHQDARRHHRICETLRPRTHDGLPGAILAGAPRVSPSLGLWTQPGVFSWDRIDPGTALLLAHAAGLSGRGADLGCGIGVLALRALESPAVTELSCLDVDRRAIDAARRNIADPRARFLHCDLRIGKALSSVSGGSTGEAGDGGLQLGETGVAAAPSTPSGSPSPKRGGEILANLDFVIMNPPFHHDGREDRGLGLAFISAAAALLRKGGVCRMVANVSLPYEGRLTAEFASARLLAQSGGYKAYEAVK